MSKPDWKDAPDDAEWLAQDLDGWWHWYPSEPLSRSTVWMNKEEDWTPACQGVSATHWRSTLERRP